MSPHEPFRVATFNVHGGRPAASRARTSRLDATAAALCELRADVAALQEVHRFNPAGVLEHQPARLRRLTGDHVVFQPSLALGPVAYGNALVTRTVPVASLRTTLPGRGEPRSVTESHVVVSGERLRVLNTHLSLRPECRLRQVRDLLRLIGAGVGPLILAGDLNCAPDSPEIALLLEQGLRHAVDPAIPTFPSVDPRLRLDYLLVSPELQALAGGTHATYASDHLPLYADLVVR